MGDLWGGPFQGSPVCLILLIYFGCAGSSLLLRLFSTCDEWGLLTSCDAQASLGGFSHGAQALRQAGFSSCSTWLINCGPQA